MLPKHCPKCRGAYEIDEYTCPTCKVRLERRSIRQGANPPVRRWAWPHALFFVSEICFAVIGSAIITPVSKSLWYSYYKERYVPNNLFFVVAGAKAIEKVEATSPDCRRTQP